MKSRRIAGKVIFQVLHDGQSLTAALEQAFKVIPDAFQDRAFIQALCFGTVRQYHRLDFILSHLLRKPLKNMHIKSVALIGLYQLSGMRVKPHAAVAETVSVVKKVPWAKALINAVLRRYLREKDQLEQMADAESSAAWSHPEWIISELKSQWPDDYQQLLAANNQQAPMALRVNLTRCNQDQFLEKLREKDITAVKSTVCPSAVILEHPVIVDEIPGFAAGLVSVQDQAAQLAAGLLDLQPMLRVLDVCAAPGGKTGHILEAQPGLDNLVAVDIDQLRLEKVAENLSRLQLSAQLLVGDGSKSADWWDGVQFDRILLDAPCSALGVIRRHPDIKLLRHATDIENLQKLQKQILHSIWPLLAPGGKLLYATCSVLKQENVHQISEFVKQKDDAVEVLIDTSWGISQEFGRQILTGDSGMDGFYYALLAKQ